MAHFHVIIPAAGTGNRMESSLPKQYLPILGKPMMTHCLRVFLGCPRVTSVHLALSPKDEYWPCLQFEANAHLHLHNTGGDSRAQTVLNTLNSMKVADDDWVLVHDAARPGLDNTLLNHLLDSLQDDAVGGLLALPLADTLKQSNLDSRSEKTIPREHLWQAQTPQMFRYASLKEALHLNGGSATDEAQAIEALGLLPKLVVGSLKNMKVTYPQDVFFVETLMKMDVK